MVVGGCNWLWVVVDGSTPGDFPPTSSKISSQSASRSMQDFGGPFDIRNVLTTCIICLTCHEMLIQWSFEKLVRNKSSW